MTPDTFYEAEETIRNEWKRRFFEEVRSRHSEAVKRGMVKRAEAGLHLHRVPVGYQRVWQDGVFVIEPDPVQAVHVYQAFSLMATGKYSLRKLLALMTKQGLRTANGKKMSIASFHNMLSNPFYAGLTRTGESLAVGRRKAIVSYEVLKIKDVFLNPRERQWNILDVELP